MYNINIVTYREYGILCDTLKWDTLYLKDIKIPIYVKANFSFVNKERPTYKYLGMLGLFRDD